MYRVYCDGKPLYDYRTNKYPISDAALDLELNKTGSFSFCIYPTHPNIGYIRKMRSIITIYQGDYLLFRGRVLNAEEEFYNSTLVTCEGELAFLLDSAIVGEGTKESPVRKTPRQHLTDIINKHNERMSEGDNPSEWKKFGVGEIDLGKDDDGNAIADQEADFYGEGYNTAWDWINNSLLDVYEGYLWVTDGADENGNAIRLINYYADFERLSGQTVELGKNLLDVRKTTKGEEIVTALIPVGGSSDSSVTIADLADGEVGRIDFDGEEGILIKKGDYIYCDKAVEKYGWIFSAVTYSDIENADDLLKEAIKELSDKAVMNTAIELTAADLAGIKNVDPFRLGVKIKAKSKPHNLDSVTNFLVKKLSINILDPSNNKLTINDTVPTYTQETEKTLKSVTVKSTKGIMEKVAQEYYSKADAVELVKTVETQYTQTNEAFEMKFTEFLQDVNDLAAGTDARFQEISKYIRFEDGNIILGEIGNEVTLRIDNDRISFLQNGAEVAYFSNRKLYVVNGEFLGQLKLGNYAFEPQEDGSLTFGLIE